MRDHNSKENPGEISGFLDNIPVVAGAWRTPLQTKSAHKFPALRHSCPHIISHLPTRLWSNCMLPWSRQHFDTDISGGNASGGGRHRSQVVGRPAGVHNRPELTLSGHFWTSLQHFNDIYRYVAPMQVPDFSAKSGKTA